MINNDQYCSPFFLPMQPPPMYHFFYLLNNSYTRDMYETSLPPLIYNLIAVCEYTLDTHYTELRQVKGC